jgi:hypothetical protein
MRVGHIFWLTAANALAVSAIARIHRIACDVMESEA